MTATGVVTGQPQTQAELMAQWAAAPYQYGIYKGVPNANVPGNIDPYAINAPVVTGPGNATPGYNGPEPTGGNTVPSGTPGKSVVIGSAPGYTAPGIISQLGAAAAQGSISAQQQLMQAAQAGNSGALAALQQAKLVTVIPGISPILGPSVDPSKLSPGQVNSLEAVYGGLGTAAGIALALQSRGEIVDPALLGIAGTEGYYGVNPTPKYGPLDQSQQDFFRNLVSQGFSQQVIEKYYPVRFNTPAVPAAQKTVSATTNVFGYDPTINKYLSITGVFNRGTEPSTVPGSYSFTQTTTPGSASLGNFLKNLDLEIAEPVLDIFGVPHAQPTYGFGTTTTTEKYSVNLPSPLPVQYTLQSTKTATEPSLYETLNTQISSFIPKIGVSQQAEINQMPGVSGTAIQLESEVYNWVSNRPLDFAKTLSGLMAAAEVLGFLGDATGTLTGRMAESGIPGIGAIGRAATSPAAGWIATSVNLGVGSYFVGSTALNVYNQPTTEAKGEAVGQAITMLAGFYLGGKLYETPIPSQPTEKPLEVSTGGNGVRQWLLSNENVDLRALDTARNFALDTLSPKLYEATQALYNLIGAAGQASLAASRYAGDLRALDTARNFILDVSNERLSTTVLAAGDWLGGVPSNIDRISLQMAGTSFPLRYMDIGRGYVLDMSSERLGAPILSAGDWLISVPTNVNEYTLKVASSDFPLQYVDAARTFLIGGDRYDSGFAGQIGWALIRTGDTIPSVARTAYETAISTGQSINDLTLKYSASDFPLQSIDTARTTLLDTIPDFIGKAQTRMANIGFPSSSFPQNLDLRYLDIIRSQALDVYPGVVGDALSGAVNRGYRAGQIISDYYGGFGEGNFPLSQIETARNYFLNTFPEQAFRPVEIVTRELWNPEVPIKYSDAFRDYLYDVVIPKYVFGETPVLRVEFTPETIYTPTERAILDAQVREEAIRLGYLTSPRTYAPGDLLALPSPPELLALPSPTWADYIREIQTRNPLPYYSYKFPLGKMTADEAETYIRLRYGWQGSDFIEDYLTGVQELRWAVPPMQIQTEEDRQSQTFKQPVDIGRLNLLYLNSLKTEETRFDITTPFGMEWAVSQYKPTTEDFIAAETMRVPITDYITHVVSSPSVVTAAATDPINSFLGAVSPSPAPSPRPSLFASLYPYPQPYPQPQPEPFPQTQPEPYPQPYPQQYPEIPEIFPLLGLPLTSEDYLYKKKKKTQPYSIFRELLPIITPREELGGFKAGKSFFRAIGNQQILEIQPQRKDWLHWVDVDVDTRELERQQRSTKDQTSDLAGMDFFRTATKAEKAKTGKPILKYAATKEDVDMAKLAGIRGGKSNKKWKNLWV